METIASLIQEIDDLVTNPNENALKSFHCFLRNENISKGELEAWALAKPCQVIPLATVVVENPTGLAVFNGLATLPAFVDAVLELRPLWLASHLDNVGSNTIGDPSTGHLIDFASLVSSGALRYRTHHSSAIQLIQEAAVAVTDRPNEATLRRLSEMCNAFRSNVLEYFTEDILAKLSSRCKLVCSGPAGTKNDIEIMLAQDILAQLAVAFQAPQTPSKSSLETPPGAKFSETCRKRIFKLFSGPNASTTLKITVLRLSMFCSQERGFSPPAALEGIRLAQRIVAPVIEHVRRQWMQKNPRLIEKFLSRLNRQALDLNIRLEGVFFCALLVGLEKEMLPTLKKVAGAALVDLCDPQTGHDSAIAIGNEKIIADILVCLCPLIASPNSTVSGPCAVLTRMMSFIVEQCQPWCANAVNTQLRLYRAKTILKSLQSALNRSGILESIVEFVQLGYVPEWWDSEVAFPLLSQSDETMNCRGEEVCSKSLNQLRSELAIDFSSLLLTAAWHSSRSLQTPETCQRLLNRLRRPCRRGPNPHCSYGAEQIMGLKDAGAPAVGDCDELGARLKSETAQRISLECRLAQSEKLLEEEQKANNVMQQDLEAAERECSDNAKALRLAKEDYQQLLREGDRRIQATESKFRHEELMYRADLLRRESELEDEVIELGSILKRKDEELQLEKQLRADLAGEMEAASAQAKHQIEELGQVVAEQEKALKEADSLKTRLTALLGGKLE